MVLPFQCPRAAEEVLRKQHLSLDGMEDRSSGMGRRETRSGAAQGIREEAGLVLRQLVGPGQMGAPEIDGVQKGGGRNLRRGRAAGKRFKHLGTEEKSDLRRVAHEAGYSTHCHFFSFRRGIQGHHLQGPEEARGTRLREWFNSKREFRQRDEHTLGTKLAGATKHESTNKYERTARNSL